MLNRTAVPMIVLVGGLSGFALAPDPALATLPVALNVVGLGLCTYPAASIMRRIGRRAGFVLGSVVAGLSAIAAALAIMAASFAGLCIACAVLGANQAFVHQYRFAAAENVASSRVSQAVSLLLFVSLVSAFAGPELGRHGRDWVADAPFAGAFFGLAAVHLLARARHCSRAIGTQAPSATRAKARSGRSGASSPSRRTSSRWRRQDRPMR